MKKAMKKKEPMSVNHNKSTMAGASRKTTKVRMGAKKKHTSHKKLY